MKKLFFVILCFLASFALVGCDTKKESSSTEDEKTVLTIAIQTLYSGTNANENNYPMILAIKEFEKNHPDIKVEVLRAPQVPNSDETGTVEQGWVDFLASLAASNTFPDVFMAPNMPQALMQGWCYDMTDLVKDDETFKLMYEDFADSGKYYNRQFAIPFTYEFFGYFVNNTLFDEENIDAPEFGVTIDELIETAKRITKLQEGGNSVIGISGAGEMHNYLATQFDPKLGWFAYNKETETFDLDGNAFKQAVEYNLIFWNGKTFSNDALTEEERTAYFGTNDWFYPWWNGKEGIHFDYSSLLMSLINAKNAGDISFDFDFIGIPIGEKGGTMSTPIKPTFMMMGKNTKHASEAYELLKWLSFDPECYAYKMQVSREVEGIYPWVSPPLTGDETAQTAYFDLTYPDYPELKKVIQNGNFYFDAWAIMPGFENARWLNTYKEGVDMSSIINQICNLGTEKLGDHVSEIKRLMNEYIAQTNNRLKEIYGIDE